MKITIDTKEDSKDEIKKIIQMLSNFLEVENKDVYVNKSNIFSDDNAAESNTDKEEIEKVETAFGSIFNDPVETNNDVEKEESPAEDARITSGTNSVGNKEPEEEIKIDIPEVEEY
tara:strand:- start:3441 stop:3788 length:348 start_codon:yes stop_codon:yes gene_type:complete